MKLFLNLGKWILKKIEYSKVEIIKFLTKLNDTINKMYGWCTLT